jgi:hypothetical protein
LQAIMSTGSPAGNGKTFSATNPYDERTTTIG